MALHKSVVSPCGATGEYHRIDTVVRDGHSASVQVGLYLTKDAARTDHRKPLSTTFHRWETSPWVKGQEPYAELYAALKLLAAYSGATDD